MTLRLRTEVFPSQVPGLKVRSMPGSGARSEDLPNPILTDLFALIGLAVVGVVGYGIYAANKAKTAVATSTSTAPVTGPVTTTTSTALPGPIDPATNLVIYNRFTDADLTGETGLTNGLATIVIDAQILDSTGTAHTVQITGYGAAGATTSWYGSIVGAATPTAATFPATEVAGISTDGGVTWLTSPPVPGVPGVTS